METAEPILVETIGTTSVVMRPVQNGGYVIKTEGECNHEVFKTLIEQAVNEFYYMIFKLGEFTEGRNCYE